MNWYYQHFLAKELHIVSLTFITDDLSASRALLSWFIHRNRLEQGFRNALQCKLVVVVLVTLSRPFAGLLSTIVDHVDTRHCKISGLIQHQCMARRQRNTCATLPYYQVWKDATKFFFLVIFAKIKWHETLVSVYSTMPNYQQTNVIHYKLLNNFNYTNLNSSEFT